MEKRKVIGVLVGGIADDFTVQTCRGVMREAQNREVDVVVIPGKYINRNLRDNKDLMYEYQYNTLFSYAGEQRFDALLVAAGSIGCYAEESEIQEFLAGLSGVPCILVGDKKEGFLSVNYDNCTGVREGLEYLICGLNCKKILMFGGPHDNMDALERKQTFLEVMQSHGLAVEETAFVEGNLTRNQKRAFLECIDRNPDVEAIFCVNDDVALGAYEALKERGLEPGRDVFVMGYDNTIQGAKAKPSLSTVMADATVLGRKALELAMDEVNGKETKSVVVPTRFIKRESFGTEHVKRKDAKLCRLDASWIDRHFDEIFYRSVMENNDNHFRSVFRTIMEMVIGSYEEKELAGGGYEEGTIFKFIEAFLQMGALEYADIENLLFHVEEIGELIMEKHGNGVGLHEAHSSISRMYHDIIFSEEQGQWKMHEREEQKNYDLKMFVTKSMQFEKGSSQSYEVLLQNLKWLDIHHAILYAYEKPVVHLDQEGFSVPKHLYVRAMLHEGKVQTTFGRSQRKRSKDIFRNSLFQEGKPTQLLLPLFSNETLYGVLLCDMSEKLFENGEFLAGQLGVAVKMLHLLKMNEDIQNQYEASMVVLRENNIALDALAKSDGLTGSLNRRGFMEEAAKCLEKNRRNKKDSLVAYIDMNNLKIINDRYGHDEGDFSIQLIARLLKENFPEGVVGRIGGDEFALLVEDTGEDLQEIKFRLYNAFRVFNAGSDKAYNVMVSAGFYVVGKEQGTELSDALAFADEKLYAEKQNRSKTVAKDAVEP